MAFSEAISGATSSRVMRRTSSMASTLSGSAIARNSLFSSRETGTTLWLWAISRGQQVGHFQRDADAGEIDGRRVEHAAHGDGHVLLADVGLFEDQLEQAGAFLLLLLEQFFDLLGGQQAVLDQGVGDAFTK